MIRMHFTFEDHTIIASVAKKVDHLIGVINHREW